MKLKWLLTAGFEIDTDNYKIFIDPFISRPKNAVPQLKKITIDDIKKGNVIFLSHGHFDHAFDLPQIVEDSDIKIYCSEPVSKMLTNKFNISKRNVQAVKGGDLLKFEPDFSVNIIKSKHIRYNTSLILKKIFNGDILNLKKSAGMGIIEVFKWRAGQVLGYLFEFKEGKKILHFGSGGYIKDEIAKLPKDIDYFLAPVAGRSDSDKYLAKLTGLITPKTVIPHHFDDFFPHLSWMAYGNFNEELKKVNPNINILKLEPELEIEI
ncbi:MAG: MBL fold metallo-hydrolase [Candidatus Lokiarchaeota archaeon]|nr:MBL fold metallo-hydrolase [Candidatus Lokiarchaeota archaeon]